ncbi:MAG: porin [Burkholderiaceae bacterium]
MKKTLIAIAIAAVVPAGAMAASEVRMYGIADAFIGYQDPDGGASTWGVGSGGQSTSRWGVDGTEDLGGGLAAVFKFESALTVDDGSAGGIAFQRRSYVGLNGGFGELTLGRNYTPLFWVLLGNDAGGMAHTVHDFPGGDNGRWNNGIHYAGSFGGLKLYGSYAASETGADDAASVAARFSVGAFGVSLGYQDGDGLSGTGNQEIKHVGANATFGGVKFGVNYIDSDDFGDPRIGISGLVKIGAAGSLLVNVVDGGQAAGAPDPDMAFQIFYRQGLSKRTNWYAGYIDRTGSELQFGIRHRF